MEIKIHSAYDLPESVKCKSGKSCTMQEAEAECNINTIMDHYKGKINLTRAPTNFAKYGDYTNVGNYHQAVDANIQLEDAFKRIPATVRERFNNDPQKLLQWLDKPENAKEAISLGLLIDDTPKPVRVVDVDARTERTIAAKKAKKEAAPPST